MEMDSYSRQSLISMYFWAYGKIKWPLIAGLLAIQLFLFLSLFQNLRADPVSLLNIQVALRDLVLIFILRNLTETLTKVEDMRKKFNEALAARAAERKGREEKAGFGIGGVAASVMGADVGGV